MSGTEPIALHPGLAEGLAAAIAAAGTAAGDLRADLTAQLGEADEDALAMERVLSGLATWAVDAERDLRWRIDLMVLIDGAFAGPGGLLAGDLPVSRPAGLALLGRTIAQRVRDGLPLGPLGVPSGDPDALAAAYPGLAAALATLSRHAHDPQVAGAFLATLGSARTLALLEVIVQTQLAKAQDPSEDWMARDVRADLLLPVAAAFTTAARSHRVDAGLLDALASADGVLPRAAAGALLMEVDVPALGNPAVQGALWSIPLGYATWPAAQRVLTDAFGAWIPGTADPMHPEALDRVALLREEALRGLEGSPEIAYRALTHHAAIDRLLEEYEHGDLGQSDRAGTILEQGLLVHPHEQGWTADLEAAARTHPEWGAALSHVITQVAALDAIPAPGSDSLARLLAPHMPDVAGIARGPRKGELLLQLGDDHDAAAIVLRDYLANALQHDEGLAAYRDVLSSFTVATLAPLVLAERDEPHPQAGSTAADLRGIHLLTQYALNEAGVQWERQNWLWLQVPKTAENVVELLVTARMKPVAQFAAGEVIDRAVERPSSWVDEQVRSLRPQAPVTFAGSFNSQLQKLNTMLLLAALPAEERNRMVPIALPPVLENRRTEEAPWYAPWQDDQERTVIVDSVMQWDAENLNAWLEDNARAYALQEGQVDMDVNDYWLIAEANARTGELIPYLTDENGDGEPNNAFDWQLPYARTNPGTS